MKKFQPAFARCKWKKGTILSLMLAFVLSPCALLAQEQHATVLMKNGTVPLSTKTIDFYDSGGKPVGGQQGYSYGQYRSGEDLTLTFTPQSTNCIVAQFYPQASYGVNGYNGTYALRLYDDASLSVYEGTELNDDHLIVSLTGLINGGFCVASHTGKALTFVFHSGNSGIVDEGWQAYVRQESSRPLLPPIVQSSPCENKWYAYRPVLPKAGETLPTYRYTCNVAHSESHEFTGWPEAPTASTGTAITLPAVVDFLTGVSGPEKDTLNLIFKVFSGKEYSDELRVRFAYASQPAMPAISRQSGTNLVDLTAPQVPAGRIDEYFIVYTTNGDTPAATLNGNTWTYTGTRLSGTDPIDIATTTTTTTTSITVKAITVSERCGACSAVQTEVFTQVYLPAPVVTVNDADGSFTIVKPDFPVAYNIRYRVNGGDWVVNALSAPANTLNVGDAVRVEAYNDNAFFVNNTVYAIRMTTNGASGVSGETVFLNDWEDIDNWTYYTGVDPTVDGGAYNTNYLGKLYAPNARNIIIHYRGGSVGGASAVAISGQSGEGQNRLVYLQTMEQGSTEGEYPYTVIPNPFSKRPRTNNTSGTNGFYGFAGWKIIAGGEYIKDKRNDDVLSLEEEITFENLDNNATIIFEATWTTATVITGTSAPTFSGGTYETNFWVLTGSASTGGFVWGVGFIDPAFTDLSQNMTISNYYPDGASTGTTNAHSQSISVSNSFEGTVKFEWISLNLSSYNTINANGRNLYIGRGVTNGGNSGKLYGCNSDNTVNQTLRVESGTYLNLYHYGSTVSAGKHTKQHIILGCDYDRAKGDNTKLTITGEMRGGNSISVNKSSGEEISQTIGKSGKFVSNYHAIVHDAAANYCYYVGISGTHNKGYKSLEIQGGEWANIAGGMDENNDSDKPSFLLRIKGGTVNGSIYGAATFAGAAGTRIFVITGGTIKGWVAGGANGTEKDGGELAGASYLYVGGNASVNSSGSETVINRAVGGNVFGAGCGYNASSSSGEVTLGTNVVIADNAYVERGVYGGGSYGFTQTTSNLYITGNAEIACNNGGVNGTSYTASVPGGVYGGASMNKGGSANIFMTGGNVAGNVYGGSNTSGDLSGNTDIKILGGVLGTEGNTGNDKGNVFGAGMGESTVVNGNTSVTIGGTAKVHGDVFGGGNSGDVGGNASVTILGGTVYGNGTSRGVFGAGLGSNSNVAGNVNIRMEGGQVMNVYGGGQAGTVAYDSVNAHNSAIMADVRILGGEVGFAQPNGTVSGGNVFGGGYEGTTQGFTMVTVSGTAKVNGNVFGGAWGKKNAIYVAGRTCVNVLGGTIYGNVYGGNRNANDGWTIVAQDETMPTLTDAEKKKLTTQVNYSAGEVRGNVYGAGFFGHTYGSSYVYIGRNAILNAPMHNHVLDETFYNAFNLNLMGSVYAGSDWGSFSGGSFGEATIEGNSNIYIDGTDYDTETDNPQDNDFMRIGGSIYSSIYGCGTSCIGGALGANILIRNYGRPEGDPADEEPFSSATRDLYSIQYGDSLIIDNSHLNFIGQGQINTLITTRKWSIREFNKTVILTNGSSLILKAPVSQIAKLEMTKCSDGVGSGIGSNTYNADAVYEAVSNADCKNTANEGTFYDNRVRVDNGSFLEVKYVDSSNDTLYHELRGFGHLISPKDARGAIYARPKNAVASPSSIDNAADGGWVAYDSRKLYNTYTYATDNTEGTLVPEGGSDQIAYTNYVPTSKDDSKHLRIWRLDGDYNFREAVLNATVNGDDNTYSTTFADVTLPALPKSSGSTHYVYRIERDTISGLANFNFGTDAICYNAALPDGIEGLEGNNTNVDGHWMYYGGDPLNLITNGATSAVQNNLNNGILALPDVNFGLAYYPMGGLSGQWRVICDEARELLAADNCFSMDNNETALPRIRFVLTYSNNITANAVLDPVVINMACWEVETEEVDGVLTIKEYKNKLSTTQISLTINTTSRLTGPFVVNSYAKMDGNGEQDDTFSTIVALPAFATDIAGDPANFYLKSVTFTPVDGVATADNWKQSSVFSSEQGDKDFGMTIAPSRNTNNQNTWIAGTDFTPIDLKQWAGGYQPEDTLKTFGSVDGRSEFSFELKLHFNGKKSITESKQKLGTLHVTLQVDNMPSSGRDTKDIALNVDVYRLGKGTNFYIDGKNGSASNDGSYPDKAVDALDRLLGSRSNWSPGDNIFIVDTVTVSRGHVTNSKAIDGVNIYRYPGGHKLSAPIVVDGTSYEYDSIVNGEPVYKGCFTGAMIVVEGTAEIRNVNLHGFQTIHDTLTAKSRNNGYGNGFYDNGSWKPTQAPMISLKEGAQYTMSQVTMTGNSNQGGNGGAIAVGTDAVLKMSQGMDIQNNYASGNGGGVFMNGDALYVGDNTKITRNFKGATVASGNVANNVYLNNFLNVVQIDDDTDNSFAALNTDARIGISSTNAWEGHYYVPVVYADKLDAIETVQNNPDMITDDKGIYNLVVVPKADQVYQTAKYNQVLNFVGTWVTAVTSQPAEFNKDQIDTPEELAWVISLVNGYNGQTAQPNYSFNITRDIDMSANIWVPIGATESGAFTGTCNGNGYIVEGLRSPLSNDALGMFGFNKGTVKAVIAKEVNFNGYAPYIGAVAGNNGESGQIFNCVAGGTLVGNGSTNLCLGGLVGANSGTIHSVFSADTIVMNAAIADGQYVGGLIGKNEKDLKNAYSDAYFKCASGGTVGGLVGHNASGATVENCYVIPDLATGTNYAAFAANNEGAVNYCYAPTGTTNFVNGTTAPSGHGTYSPVYANNVYGYMYEDNTVTLESGQANPYVVSEIQYQGNVKSWPGMVSALNNWVNGQTGSDYAPWARPTCPGINLDLPLLRLGSSSCAVAFYDSPRFLNYGRDLPTIVAKYNAYAEGGSIGGNRQAHIFIYGDAVGSENPASNVEVHVNEDATLVVDGSNKYKAYVGVTLDNSNRSANAWDGTSLGRDWHMIASPLKDAPIGINYTVDGTDWNAEEYEAGDNPDGSSTGHWGNPFHGCDNLDSPIFNFSTTDGYFPTQYYDDNTLRDFYGDKYRDWDFYCWYEPAYHWINFKRNGPNHWHYDTGAHIEYGANESSMTPGKGYLMAIENTTYLVASGNMNADNTIERAVTAQGAYSTGYNLLGNPYQAYLDMSAFNTNNRWMKSASVYDADKGMYLTVNPEASSGADVVGRYLHPHQGFFALTEEAATASFTKAMAATKETATAGNNNPYLRGEVRKDYPLVNLYLSNGDQACDVTVIEFNRPEFGGSTKMERLRNGNGMLYAHHQGEPYSVFFAEEGVDNVAVRFVASEAGTFTLNWNTHNGRFEVLTLIDNIAGVSYDMLRHDSYTFQGDPKDYASRFKIVFSVKSEDEPIDEDENAPFAFFDGSNWLVNGQGHLLLVDVLGRTLYSGELHDSQNSVNFNVARGVYVLTLVGEDKSVKSQKIVIQNR